jgi:hypothetical protein
METLEEVVLVFERERCTSRWKKHSTSGSPLVVDLGIAQQPKNEKRLEPAPMQELVWNINPLTA